MKKKILFKIVHSFVAAHLPYGRVFTNKQNSDNIHCHFDPDESGEEILTSILTHIGVCFPCVFKSVIVRRFRWLSERSNQSASLVGARLPDGQIFTNKLSLVSGQLLTNKLQFLVVIALFTLLAQPVAGQTFSDLGVPFEIMTNGRAEWVDFNNDGNLDLFVGGTTSGGGVNKVVIYYNNGDDTFATLDLAGLRDITYDFGDYNDDGFIDILLAGTDATSQKVFDVYQSNSGTSFTPQSLGLTGFSLGGVSWVDLDHDADYDIVAMGRLQGGGEVTLLYEYDNAIYTLVPNTLPTLGNGKVQAFDANNDGLNEVLLTGVSSSGVPTSVIYTFANDWTNSLYTTLDGYSLNSVDLVDYNEDGFVDIGITGASSAGFVPASNLYTNNGVNGFIRVSTFMDSLSSSSIDFGDLDNDGLEDIVLTGLDQDNSRFLYYYRNAESGGSYAFSSIAHSLETIYSGDVAIGDYNNDSDLDIFQIGNSNVMFQANLFTSNQSLTTVNNAPSAPTNLLADTDEDTVFLSWDAATDDLTHVNSLTYNVYISENPGGADLTLSPLSDISTGYRRIMKAGNAGYRTELSMHDLPEGNYSWSVQTLDNAYKGSAFATEGTFTICHPFSLGSDTTICANESITLAAGAGADIVNWHSLVEGVQVGGPALSYEHLVTQKDTIVAEYTKVAFGCTVYDTIVVDVIALPDFDLGSDTLVCFQESLDLEILGFDSVNWYSPGEGLLAQDDEQLSFLVTKKDTLIAEIFNVGKCVNYDSIIVDVIALPTHFLGNDTSICYQENIELQALGFDSVNWYATGKGSLLQNNESLVYQVLEKDTLIAEFFNAGKCVNYDSIIIDVIALPVFDLGSDTTICYAEYIELEVNEAGVDSVNWYSKSSGLLLQNNSVFNYQVLELDTLIAEFFNTSRCVSYDTIKIDVFPLPVFDIGNDTAICYNSSILLQLPDPSFTEINWYSKNSGGLLEENNWFFDYTVTETDTIIAEVYNTNGCLNYDTIAIAMNPLPDYDLGIDQGICLGDSVTLEVSGTWAEVNWLTAGDQLLQDNNHNYKYMVVDTVTLWTEVYTAERCLVQDTLTINALPLPEFELGGDRINCFGDSILFDIGAIGETYTWVNQSDEQVSAEPTWGYVGEVSDKLFLEVTDGYACSFSDSVSVNINALPDFEISGADEVCDDDTTALTIEFGAFDEIQWYTAEDTFENATLAYGFAPLETTWLYATLIDPNSCVNTDSLLVTVNVRPEAFAGLDTLICYDDEVRLGQEYLDTDYSFNWLPITDLNDATISNPLADPNTSVTYQLEVTDSKGCNSFDSVFVQVNPEIILNAGEDLAICFGDTATLGSDPTVMGSTFDYDFQWTPARYLLEQDVANPRSVPDSTTQYVLEVRSGDCAVEYDTLLVTVNYAPEIEVSPQQSVGGGQSVQLFASGGVAYLWSPETSLDNPNIADPISTPLETTEYEVIVTDANGCFSSDTVNVLVQNTIFLPNLFTPNGDNSNDQFMVYGSGIKEIQFSVYDLGGTRVFYTNDVEQAQQVGWDGTYNGKSMVNGTYLWTLGGVFHDGSGISFNGKNRGTIKLLR